MTSKEEIAKMTVPDLKAALKELGLPVTGKKDDLVQRLLTAKAEGGAEPATEGAETAASEPAAAAEAAAPAEVAADAEAAKEDAAGDDAAAAAPAVPSKPAKHAPIVFNAGAAATAASVKVQVVKPAEAEEEAKPDEKKVAAVSETDKIKLRADKFKDPEVEKAKQRAQRFGLSHPEIEKEKELKRAERFGIAHPELEDAKKRQRAERFGVIDPALKMELRKEKFKALPSAGATTGLAALSDDIEARKKARAERFGTAS